MDEYGRKKQNFSHVSENFSMMDRPRNFFSFSFSPCKTQCFSRSFSSSPDGNFSFFRARKKNPAEILCPVAFEFCWLVRFLFIREITGPSDKAGRSKLILSLCFRKSKSMKPEGGALNLEKVPFLLVLFHKKIFSNTGFGMQFKSQRKSIWDGKPSDWRHRQQAVQSAIECP